MQLMMPTPMKALRQARNASPSSERRTPGTAAIKPDLFDWTREHFFTDVCVHRP
jgi:hypothetical protein